MTVIRCNTETIDDYLNRFRQLKSRCFTQIQEHELVQMVVACLKFSIQKKLVNQKFRDMAQLANIVWWIEQLKFENEQNKRYNEVVSTDKFAILEWAYNLEGWL